MKSIILIAPPAAGKGTLSNILSKRYNIPHISTGDLLRQRASVDDEFGIELLCLLKSGDLVSDDIVLDLLRNRLAEPDCKNGYLLDGYPRNISQAKRLDSMLSELNLKCDLIVNLDIDMENAYKRISGRMSCPNCGATYNKNNISTLPKVEGICDECGSKLIVRADDNRESFIERFEVFNKYTLPVIEYYENSSNFVRFDGTMDSNIIADKISEMLEGDL